MCCNIWKIPSHIQALNVGPEEECIDQKITTPLLLSEYISFNGDTFSVFNDVRKLRHA